MISVGVCREKVIRTNVELYHIDNNPQEVLYL